MSRKKSEDPAVKKSFSMPTSLYSRMLKRMETLGFNSESAYLQFLTRNDVVRQDSPVIAVEIPATKTHPQQGNQPSTKEKEKPKPSAAEKRGSGIKKQQRKR